MKNWGEYMENYTTTAQRLLRQLGVNGSYAGFKYTACGITKTINNPELITYICKGLYAEIAIQYHVNISNVERNIRTIVDIIWKSGNRKLLNEVCGKELTEKPKNAYFFDAISQYIIHSCDQ